MNWDKEFGDEAKEPKGIPFPSYGMSRDIFNRDQKEILLSAKRYGFKMVGATDNDPFALKMWKAQVSFTKF